MDAITNLDLGDLHQAIIDAIGERFPHVATVEAYKEDRKSLLLPACLIELMDMEPAPDDDPGTEQLAVTARFSAQVVMGFRTPEVKREIRKFAAALAAFVHMKRWGLPIAPAEVTGIEPDDFEPALDRFEVWRVEWQQIIHLGETVWTNEGTIPTEVLASYEPETGVPNENKYMPIAETEL